MKDSLNTVSHAVQPELEWLPPMRSRIPKEMADSLLNKEVAGDSVQPTYAMVISSTPLRKETMSESGEGYGVSWIYLILLLVFTLVGLRLRSNTKYLGVVVADLTEVRERANAFDDTVRETSFLLLLNILWVASAGVVLYGSLVYLTAQFGAADYFGAMPALKSGDGGSMGLCMGIAAVYSMLMALAYWVVGNVFSDRSHTESWVKGYLASQGLTGLFLFPISMLLLARPIWVKELLIAAAVVYGLGKIVFIYKGFRIFFVQISSWLLFLYYLCSLELVPLILTYVAALAICA